MTEIETQAVHGGSSVDPATGAVTPPIHLTTTFERAADGSYPHGYEYTRENNPNRQELERALAALEGGAYGVAFASGSTAAMMILQTLKTGDHIVVPTDLYFGIRVLIQDVFSAWGLEHTFVDTTDLDAVQAAVQPNTRLVMIETPSNPLLKVTDIAATAEIAHSVGALLICDNTIPSPALQQPFQHGADVILHATTKYISGHADVLGGMVVCKEENDFYTRLRYLQRFGGAVPSPFDCWLALRGLRTLPYRARAHAENALKVAQFLESHPNIEQVNYPGLESHANHTVAQKQMGKYGFGGLMSVQVKGDAAQAMDVVARMQVFIRATSFGGTHSLIEHRASMEAPGSTTPQNLLRVSIGLEHADDLIADLDQALDYS